MEALPAGGGTSGVIGGDGMLLAAQQGNLTGPAYNVAIALCVINTLVVALYLWRIWFPKARS
jgi:hypothetical protein